MRWWGTGRHKVMSNRVESKRHRYWGVRAIAIPIICGLLIGVMLPIANGQNAYSAPTASAKNILYLRYDLETLWNFETAGFDDDVSVVGGKVTSIGVNRNDGTAKATNFNAMLARYGIQPSTQEYMDVVNNTFRVQNIANNYQKPSLTSNATATLEVCKSSSHMSSKMLADYMYNKYPGTNIGEIHDAGYNGTNASDLVTNGNNNLAIVVVAQTIAKQCGVGKDDTKVKIFGDSKHKCSELTQTIRAKASDLSRILLKDPRVPEPEANALLASVGIVSHVDDDGNVIVDQNVSPPDEKTCDGGAFGWVMCPFVEKTASIIDVIMGAIDDGLYFNALSDSEAAKNLQDIWGSFLALANIAFVIVFLIIIYSSATSVGLKNYDVKKILPRLVLAVIMVNVSFWICAAVSDIVNIIGSNIYGFIVGMGGYEAPSIGKSITESAALTLGLIVVVAFFGGLAILALSTLLIVAVLAFRQIAIAALIIISPIAFVMWLLPNTEKLFKRWWKAYTQMLFIYPMIMGVWALTKVLDKVVSNVSIEAGKEVQAIFSLIARVALFVAPVALIIPIMKMGGEAMGALQKLSNKGLDKTLKKPLQNMDEKQKLLNRAGWTNRMNNLANGLGFKNFHKDENGGYYKNTWAGRRKQVSGVALAKMQNSKRGQRAIGRADANATMLESREGLKDANLRYDEAKAKGDRVAELAADFDRTYYGTYEDEHGRLRNTMTDVAGGTGTGKVQKFFRGVAGGIAGIGRGYSLEEAKAYNDIASKATQGAQKLERLKVDLEGQLKLDTVKNQAEIDKAKAQWDASLKANPIAIKGESAALEIKRAGTAAWENEITKAPEGTYTAELVNAASLSAKKREDDALNAEIYRQANQKFVVTRANGTKEVVKDAGWIAALRGTGGSWEDIQKKAQEIKAYGLGAKIELAKTDAQGSVDSALTTYSESDALRQMGYADATSSVRGTDNNPFAQLAALKNAETGGGSDIFDFLANSGRMSQWSKDNAANATGKGFMAELVKKKIGWATTAMQNGIRNGSWDAEGGYLGYLKDALKSGQANHSNLIDPDFKEFAKNQKLVLAKGDDELKKQWAKMVLSGRSDQVRGPLLNGSGGQNYLQQLRDAGLDVGD